MIAINIITTKQKENEFLYPSPTPNPHTSQPNTKPLQENIPLRICCEEANECLIASISKMGGKSIKKKGL
jgi:hypothetical protein